MESDNPTRFRQPEKMLNKKCEVREKLIVILAVAHVAIGIAVSVQAAEWW